MPNRTLCDVLQEMRTTYKTRNFSGLRGLIEEAQSMGNRMESALYDKHDVENMERKYKILKQELRKAEGALNKAKELASEASAEELATTLEELANKAKLRSW